METNIYKQASRLRLRIETAKGNLTVEQLWGMSLKELDELAVDLEDKAAKSGRKSFLAETSEANRVAQMKFDIVLDILKTKKAESDAVVAAAEIKAHNQKILALIAQKKDAALADLPVEELEKQLK